ncbi:hypothetical protein D1872_311670 [compost metagenome]
MLKLIDHLRAGVTKRISQIWRIDPGNLFHLLNVAVQEGGIQSDRYAFAAAHEAFVMKVVSMAVEFKYVRSRLHFLFGYE